MRWTTIMMVSVMMGASLLFGCGGGVITHGPGVGTAGDPGSPGSDVVIIRSQVVEPTAPTPEE